MRRIGSSLLLLACLVTGLPGAAQAQDVLGLIRAGQWAAADDAAARWADPVARKLVQWYRLMTPGAASASEIVSFMQTSPDWPNQAGLAREREYALANEPDDATALALCDQFPPFTAGALLRCADAYGHAGRNDDAARALRSAWIGGVTDPAGEARLLARAGAVIGPEEQWRRFDHLLGTDSPAIGRQVQRLDPAHHAAAEAVLALRHNDAHAESLLAAVPASLRTDPAVLLEQVRWLRHAGRNEEAAGLLNTYGTLAQQAAPVEHLKAFWFERQLLARLLLASGDNAGAYALANAHGQTDQEAAADAEFLAGWIALRRLNDPVAATVHFTRLSGLSSAAITQGRAHYWLARAAAARGDAATAHAEYTLAAAWPTTFYGQLAAVALGDTPAALNARINALHDPHWDDRQALDFAGREVARAAALLASWGEPDRARPFLLRLEDLAPEAADRAMAARLASGFGLPDQAVSIARRAGSDGVMLPDIGWPMPFEPPATVTEPALTLGIIRQESNFNPSVVSPAGARGLMQLMPATARALGRLIGARVDPARLTVDIGANLMLGTTYLGQFMDQFGGSMPMAIAAYNAGPGRVAQWSMANGDPRGAADMPGARADMIDWIELIPFNETRNYVQRVTENVVIYRARRGIVAPDPVLQPTPMSVPLPAVIPADATAPADPGAPAAAAPAAAVPGDPAVPTRG